MSYFRFLSSLVLILATSTCLHAQDNTDPMKDTGVQAEELEQATSDKVTTEGKEPQKAAAKIQPDQQSKTDQQQQNDKPVEPRLVTQQAGADEQAQDTKPTTADPEAGATIRAATDDDGARTIIIKGPAQVPDPAMFYSAIVKANANVGTDQIQQKIGVTLKVFQGKAKTLSLGIKGSGKVMSVSGNGLKSWAVRQQGSDRYLDVTINDGIDHLNLQVKIQSERYNLDQPIDVQLTHLTPAESVGFDSLVNLKYSAKLKAKVAAVTGFVPLTADDGTARFQSATGGEIRLTLKRAGGTLEAIVLSDTSLNGQVHPNGDSIVFDFSATVQVNQADSEITILSGNAAVTKVPATTDYRLTLATANKRTVYKLKFAKEGTFDVSLNFVASVKSVATNDRSVDFTVAASAVVPLTISGLQPALEFQPGPESIVPSRNEDRWIGFLPATGRARLHWKTARTATEGKLFFSSTGLIDATVGAGLLRQNHQINYQVLQGELKSYRILLQGPGEILDVQGDNIVGWNVIEEGNDRLLEATLSQPITAASEVVVRTQTPLTAFPVRVEGLRLSPVGVIRHSGYLRLANSGSVRLEPTDLKGLTQLAPGQFPGDAKEARQTFVYRFPAAEHGFTVAANRIQPEVNISELVVYKLTETDRLIVADIELDIRDAAIRDWTFDVPADYSVVSVTGAGVADYIPETAALNGRRNLKVVFSKDAIGRQLVTLTMEKSQTAAAGDWVLQPIKYPNAKAVRGTIGIAGAAGYRIAVGQIDLLVEKPLSYFPKQSAELQQAFRIREPGWSATMQIEVLDRSVQADVFHLYSLSEETVYGSALINYFVTGAPVSEWTIFVPEAMGNVIVDGQDVRTWRRDGDSLVVSLHQPVMGAYTLLVTFEEKPDKAKATFQPGQVAPSGVQGERGYIQVVSPKQVEIESVSISDALLKLDPLELPAEFRLLSSAPALGTWQYTDRPVDLTLSVKWFEAGSLVTQVVEYSEANTRVSQDGELVTDILYYVKSRGRRTFKIKLPSEPVRLWAVSVNGAPVTARQAEDGTLIPLPGGTDPNLPIEVRLRLGKPAVNGSQPDIRLPLVASPVLKTLWNITGDDHHVLVPASGTVTPPVPVLRPSGFEWVAKNGITSLVMITLLVAFGIWGRDRSKFWKLLSFVSVAAAIFVCVQAADGASGQTGSAAPLQLSLPILAAGELVQLKVDNIPAWRTDLSWIGLAATIIGLGVIAWSMFERLAWRKILNRCGGMLLIALGVLLQGGSAALFFGLMGLAIAILLFIGPAFQGLRDLGRWLQSAATQRRAKKAAIKEAAGSESGPSSGPTAGPVATMIAFLIVACSATASRAALPDGFEAADSIVQQWQITSQDSRLQASGKISLTGQPGDQFVLLQAPAVLTNFQGEGLQVSKRTVPDLGLAYVVSIAYPENPNAVSATLSATFQYQLDSIKTSDVPVQTGMAAVQEIDLRYDQAGWDVMGSSAIQVEQLDSDNGTTRAKVILGLGQGSVVLKPKARDVTAEDTAFFVEASNLFLLGPGVVDGKHRFNLRVAQGQLSSLNVEVPLGLTVSSVTGPVGVWQFEADTGQLKLEIEPAQSQAFSIIIETQRSLDPLPADVKLAPLQVQSAKGEVGLMAIAFGPEAQPESMQATNMSTINLGDFDASLMEKQNAVLHRVYRYGVDGGEVEITVAPVTAEVRVSTKQVLSLGDERVVLGINFAAEISRAGLFQLSFPLPDGFEVESLTGSSLHHWAELSEDGERQIILHLNGKTLGSQKFSMTLSGLTPADIEQWQIPRFYLNEADRQSGDLIVRPTTGLRLRTISRQNISEVDPRTMGGNSVGALAFRLLQRDWDLVLAVQKLDPWVTGEVLHEVTLREGQTRAALLANFVIQNASVSALRVMLPISNEDEIKTLRATGNTVSDLVRTAPDSNIWEVQFKRRVVGNVNFRIEYERRGDRVNDQEQLTPAAFPEARQLSYYFGVRAGGRLELEYKALTEGWQRIDWNVVPESLREAENRTAPALVFRALAPEKSLTVQSKRHSLADSLKLRVAKGTLTTVLSSTGDQLTSVDVVMEVIQRSSLSVGLPQGGRLFSIFVNGESVDSIRRDDDTNTWQFYILSGLDDRTAQVRFVYSVPRDRLSGLQLSSPELNVPLENIQWNVIAPNGFRLSDNDGNLELISLTNQRNYDRNSYLSKASERRKFQAERAGKLLEQANQLLQAGEQSKARWALKSVANQYALDAASNEDARVQLENLQTQQAIVGLNSRRQRLYLDNSRNEADLVQNEQLRQAAVDNPILQQDQLNFRPGQLSQLLRGNTTADNAILQQIAARLVRHQHTTEPAVQAIIISLPEEGDVYTFGRSVQVAENAPLQLELDFESKLKLHAWKIGLLLLLLTGIAAALSVSMTRRKKLAV